VPTSGGNPGHWLASTADTFDMVVSAGAAPYVGDYRAMGVTAISLDFQIVATDFPVGGPLTLVLRDTNEGRQWLWPHFLDGKPTVLAFWSTEEMQCLRDIPALNTLARRDDGLHLVSIGTGPDRLRIDEWVRGRFGDRPEYTVLVDQAGRLAETLDVEDFPTYVLFNNFGEEIDRREKTGSHKITGTSRGIGQQFVYASN